MPIASASVRSCSNYLALQLQSAVIVLPRRTMSSHLPLRGAGGRGRTSALYNKQLVPRRKGHRNSAPNRRGTTSSQQHSSSSSNTASTSNTISSSRRLPSSSLNQRLGGASKSNSPPAATGRRRKATWAVNNNAHNSAAASAASAAAATNRVRRNLLERLSDLLGKPRTIPVPRWVTPKHYPYTLSECFGHASFFLVAVSYAVDDFLVLRIIAVAGSTAMLFFTYFHPHGRVLWLPFQWNCLFIAINSYRIGRVVWDRYLAEQLSDELIKVREDHFTLMAPTDFGQLARQGKVEVYRKGDVVVTQDEANSHVRVVLSGGLTVMRNGGLTYTLDEGNFISESGLHAGLMLPQSVDSCCTIECSSDTVRLLSWDRTELVELLERSPHLRRSLKAVLSWDIVRKLKAQRILLASGVIGDPEGWTHRRHEQGEHRYAAILKNLLSSHPHNIDQRKRELKKYRNVHHIDDVHHREALKECEWTEEEFDLGYRQDGTTIEGDHTHAPEHGPEWYIRQMVVRIVG